MAKRSCRTADWLDPTRLPRPCRGVGGTAPPASVGELGHLLQWGAHAPCTRQGFAAPLPRADSRAHRTSHLARRSPPALCSDGIIGRHRIGICGFGFRHYRERLTDLNAQLVSRDRLLGEYRIKLTEAETQVVKLTNALAAQDRPVLVENPSRGPHSLYED